MEHFDDIEFVRTPNKVVWEFIGEGMSGDYDPTDPEDTPLLRFSCYRYSLAHETWEPLDDASYCTHLPISTPVEHLKIAAGVILEALTKPSFKRELEYLSWFNPSDFSHLKG